MHAWVPVPSLVSKLWETMNDSGAQVPVVMTTTGMTRMINATQAPIPRLEILSLNLYIYVGDSFHGYILN